VLLGRIIQSGLVDKWDQDAKYEMGLNPAEELEDDDFDTFQRSLTLADLGANFTTLALGLLVSTFVFLLELCLGRHSAMCCFRKHPPVAIYGDEVVEFVVQGASMRR
jgi:hypothetical protein